MREHSIRQPAYQIFAAASLVVLVTGIFQLFFYQPSGIAQPTINTVMRAAHLWGTWIWLGLLALITALELNRRSQSGAGILGTAAVLGLGVSFTGYQLPWDQLALDAITVGTDISGFEPVVGNDNGVSFVLIDGAEVSVQTFRFWFFTHLVLGVLVLLPAIFVYRTGKEDSPKS